MARKHISHGFYRVSDREAGELAKRVGRRLPKHGYELAVEESGEGFWLARTPYGSHHPDAPRRGWVWSIRKK